VVFQLGKRKILIASFDLAIGGVERSLIGLLNLLDYEKYEVDLMLFKHEGEFLPFLPSNSNLLPENPAYATFRQSIVQIAKSGQLPIAIARTIAKSASAIHGKIKRVAEPGYLTIQYGWEISTPFLPTLEKEYDVAIGFLWPHHFIGDKVRAKKKIGWIHTDYSNIYVNKKIEANMWKNVDQIVAVSEECSNTFCNVFPELKGKTTVIENILSPTFVRQQAEIENANEIKTIKGRTVLVTVGRLSYAKGLDDAVRACRLLVDLGYDIEWHVVGYGPLEGELKQLIVELNLEERFFLLGKKTNPYPYIKACDIYVQPSRYEGKAVTIREAQILGKPVVITNFPTAKSQIQNGMDGIITMSGPKGIMEGVQRLIDNQALRESLISSVKERDYGNQHEIEKLNTIIEA